MKRLIPLLLMSGFVIAVGACTPPYPKCKEDSHCKDRPKPKTDNLVWCVKGQCVACRGAQDCPEGKECDANGACKDIPDYCSANMPCKDPTKPKCKNNRCVPECGPNDPCPPGQVCNKDNKCEPDVECRDPDKPCPAGKRCVNNKCEAIPKCPASCPEGQECSESTGFKCQDIAGYCSATKPCPPGQKCVGNRCQDATPPPVECSLKPIYFDFDKSDIREDQKAAVKENAECVKKKGGKVTVEGHCDERGTREYNVALGERRYKAAIDALKGEGADAGNLEGVSYGKEKPVCTESNEGCWQKNRRAELKFK
jgi:peptidoglycan-associated lipoprotein